MEPTCSGLLCYLDTGHVTLFSTIITALATAVLGWVTWVLARETKALSRAASQPHVVATFEPNPWGSMYVDLLISNTGNAVAYDITVSYSPDLPSSSEFRLNLPVPFQKISVLRPGQVLKSSLSPYKDLKDQIYTVSISWARLPGQAKREALCYDLTVTEFEASMYLGARNPEFQIASEIKKIREDWKSVASGGSRLEANVHLSSDREKERRERQEWLDEVRAENQPSLQDDAGNSPDEKP